MVNIDIYLRLDHNGDPYVVGATDEGESLISSFQFIGHSPVAGRAYLPMWSKRLRQMVGKNLITRHADNEGLTWESTY